MNIRNFGDVKSFFLDNKTIYFIGADSEVYNHKKPDVTPSLVCE